MPILTQGPGTGEYLMSEANGTLSRESITVTLGADESLDSGRVLAKLTATGKYVPYDNAGTDGSEVAAAVLLTPLAGSAAGGDFEATAHVRQCEVVADRLGWGAVDATGQAAGKADLALANVIAR